MIFFACLRCLRIRTDLLSVWTIKICVLGLINKTCWVNRTIAHLHMMLGLRPRPDAYAAGLYDVMSRTHHPGLFFFSADPPGGSRRTFYVAVEIDGCAEHHEGDIMSKMTRVCYDGLILIRSLGDTSHAGLTKRTAVCSAYKLRGWRIF